MEIRGCSLGVFYQKARTQYTLFFVSQQGRFTLKCMKIKYAEL